METKESIQIRQPSDITLLESMERKYRSIPMEAIIKQDVLRQGINFTRESLTTGLDYKTKDYFIFSFDHMPLSEMKKGEDKKSKPGM